LASHKEDSVSPGNLQVTYRGGRVLAAYYAVGGAQPTRSVRTEEAGPGLVVDYDRDGHPLGIEIFDPALLTLARFNTLLTRLGLPRVAAAELAPIDAA
jgi:uncharacterized protein YuzE